MDRMKYKAVLFDMDGTLLDTLDDLTDIINHTMEHFGFPKHTREEVKYFVGNGVGKLVELALPEGKDTPDFDKILAYTRAYYDVHSGALTKPYDGICETVEKLKEHDVKIAVVTNKMQSAAEVLTKKYFPTVDCVSGEREKEGVRRKPYPDSVVYAEEKMRVLPTDCIYVGDSEVDILTAHNAGLKCISVLWGFREKDFLRENGADYFAATPDELYELLHE